MREKCQYHIAMVTSLTNKNANSYVMCKVKGKVQQMLLHLLKPSLCCHSFLVQVFFPVVLSLPLSSSHTFFPFILSTSSASTNIFPLLSPASLFRFWSFGRFTFHCSSHSVSSREKNEKWSLHRSPHIQSLFYTSRSVYLYFSCLPFSCFSCLPCILCLTLVFLCLMCYLCSYTDV